MSEPSLEGGSRRNAYLALAAMAGVILTFDQWSKYFVRARLAVGESWSPAEWTAGVFRIIHWNNTGAAFGLFPGAGVVFTVVAIVVSLAILYYFPRVPPSQAAVRFALGLQLGGALGNLIDRMLLGTVTDFIAIGTFPVFNVADASISSGTALLLAAMWVEERRARSQAAGASEPEIG
jgi:signal peptidase II